MHNKIRVLEIFLCSGCAGNIEPRCLFKSITCEEIPELGF